MFEYKRIKSYRVHHYHAGPKAGKTDIIVFGQGAQYTYDSLDPARAHHMIDLLRNEDTCWFEFLSGTFIVATEPVGEGES